MDKNYRVMTDFAQKADFDNVERPKPLKKPMRLARKVIIGFLVLLTLTLTILSGQLQLLVLVPFTSVVFYYATARVPDSFYENTQYFLEAIAEDEHKEKNSVNNKKMGKKPKACRKKGCVTLSAVSNYDEEDIFNYDDLNDPLNPMNPHNILYDPTDPMKPEYYAIYDSFDS